MRQDTLEGALLAASTTSLGPKYAKSVVLHYSPVSSAPTAVHGRMRALSSVLNAGEYWKNRLPVNSPPGKKSYKWDEPKEVGPLAGALLIVGLVALGFFGMLHVFGGIAGAIMGLRTSSDLTIAFVILGFMVLALGLAMGLFVEKHGWFTGILLAFSVLSITIPIVVYNLWGFYLWTAGGNYNEAYIYVPIALGSGLVLGLIDYTIRHPSRVWLRRF